MYLFQVGRWRRSPVERERLAERERPSTIRGWLLLAIHPKALC